MKLFIKWVLTGLVLAFLIFGIYYIKNYSFNGSIFFVTTILYIAAFILAFHFIGVSLSIVSNMFNSEKKASSIEIDSQKITVLNEDTTTDVYEWHSIRRIIIGEKFDSIYINSEKSRQAYSISIDYKVLESRFDAVLNDNKNSMIKKEKQFIRSGRDDLNPNKDLHNVDYFDRRYVNHRWVISKIEPGNGREMIYYSRNSNKLN